MISCQDADGLQSLSQSHVITQDPMQLVLIQECQPVDTSLQHRQQNNLPKNASNCIVRLGRTNMI